MGELLVRWADHVVKEWHVIKEAKLALLAIAILVATGTWMVASAFYAEHIATLLAGIQYQETIVSDLRAKLQGLPTAAEVKAAQFATNGIVAGLPEEGQLLRINVNFANRGKAAAKGTNIQLHMFLRDKQVTPKEEDKMVDDVSAKVPFLDPVTMTNEVQPGEERYNTAYFDEITYSDVEATKKGEKIIYLVGVVKYTDDATPAKKIKVLEMCAWYIRDFTHTQVCQGHNYSHIDDAR
jgi:hypothetical protein